MGEIRNPKLYVIKMLKNGVQPQYYKKFARVKAKQGVVGQEVVTIMKNGLIETRNIVTLGEDNQPGWIITNPSGEQCIISNKKFIRKYELEVGPDGKHAPKGDAIAVVQVPEDITIITSWGEEQNIKAGGFLNISNIEDIYGIQKEEFFETYAACDKNGIFVDEKLRIAFSQK